MTGQKKIGLPYAKKKNKKKKKFTCPTMSKMGISNNTHFSAVS